MSTTPSQSDELENKLTNGLKHTLKLVPQSQRELFVSELARYIQDNYTPKPDVQGGGWLEDILDDHAQTYALGTADFIIRKITESEREKRFKESDLKAKAAIQAQLDAAYQRGRIDEAKTCEGAKRHG
jgi:hypothetical protein